MARLLGDKVSSNFTFIPLPNKKFPSLEGKILQESLLKWSMSNRLRAQAYSYDQFFQSYQAKEFVLNFLKDPNVTSTLQVLSDSGRPVPIGDIVDSVTVEQLSCTEISMKFFDRLYDHNRVVRESGAIVKCYEEYHEEFNVSDELRKMLLLEDSDNYSLYSESERNEFLFQIFKHLCLGGSICQYEDDIQPYLDTTKALYKDLVSVQKNKEGELIVTSLVFRVTAQDSSGAVCYPSHISHTQDFSYLIIDPIKRHVTVLYHKYGPCEL